MAWEPDYITSTELKNYVRMDPNDISEDLFLGWDITAASRAVDAYCSSVAQGLGSTRQFGQIAAPEVRYYTPRWDQTLIKWVIEIDDLMDITGLTVAIDTTNSGNYTQTITGYTLRPANAIAQNRPYTQIAINPTSNVQPTYFVDSAKVTGRWGWTAVPTAVKRATAIQAHRFNRRRTSPFGIAGSPTKGTEQRIQSAQPELDPDVKLMLQQEDLVKLGWTT